MSTWLQKVKAKQKHPLLSLCMIVKDEERFLPQCLKSAEGVADEIIVVDTGSTDKTREIARSFGARVEHFKWCDDFAAARNESLRYATGDWILILDADEELSDQRALRQFVMSQKPCPAAIYFTEYSALQNDEGVRWKVRLFPNHRGIRYEGIIHELPSFMRKSPAALIVRAPGSSMHHGYRSDVYHHKQKNDRNVRILKLQAERKQGSPCDQWLIHFHEYNHFMHAGQYEEALQAIRLTRAAWTPMTLFMLPGEAFGLPGGALNFFTLWLFELSLLNDLRRFAETLQTVEIIRENQEMHPELEFWVDSAEAKALYELGQVEEAVLAQKRAVERSTPESKPSLIRTLGLMFFNCERDEEAAGCFLDVLRVSPKDDVARKFLAETTQV